MIFRRSTLWPKSLFTVDGGIVEAVVSLFAFMFEYPKAFKNLFVYMQKYLFNIPDSGRLPSSVITFINKLGTNKQEPGKDIQ